MRKYVMVCMLVPVCGCVNYPSTIPHTNNKRSRNSFSSIWPYIIIPPNTHTHTSLPQTNTTKQQDSTKTGLQTNSLFNSS